MFVAYFLHSYWKEVEAVLRRKVLVTLNFQHTYLLSDI